MRTTIRVALITMLGCGALLLVLGLIIWAGGWELIGIHKLLGYALILSLWTICVIAVSAGLPVGTVAFAAAWGVLVLVLGLAQEELVTGSLHWTIQVTHVVISMGAIWWGRRLVGAIRQARSAAEPTLEKPSLASSASR
jgi:hypothetical protein